MTKLLLLMVLSSAAASTQTTILPTARTTLSMATYKAIPSAFGRMHKRFLTPTVSTVAMGGVSIALYVAMNYLSSGSSVIGDSVSALGVMIAFYYGLTGFACVWYYRKSLTRERPELLAAGHPPAARRPHPVVRDVLVPLVQLGHPEQQLHDVDHAGHAPRQSAASSSSTWVPSSWASC